MFHGFGVQGRWCVYSDSYFYDIVPENKHLCMFNSTKEAEWCLYLYKNPKIQQESIYSLQSSILISCIESIPNSLGGKQNERGEAD